MLVFVGFAICIWWFSPLYALIGRQGWPSKIYPLIKMLYGFIFIVVFVLFIWFWMILWDLWVFFTKVHYFKTKYFNYFLETFCILKILKLMKIIIIIELCEWFAWLNIIMLIMGYQIGLCSMLGVLHDMVKGFYLVFPWNSCLWVSTLSTWPVRRVWWVFIAIAVMANGGVPMQTKNTYWC